MKQYYVLFTLLLFTISCSKNDTEPVTEIEQPENDSSFIDAFNGSGDLVDYETNNASVLPDVTMFSGRYHASLTDNMDNKTLHFNQEQGRIDAKLVTFPFEFIARNIGIGTIANSQIAPEPNNNPYIFSGIQVHVKDFNSINSSHVVVGHRGPTGYTIEGKNTVNGNSSVNDIGANTVPNGKADIKIEGDNNHTLKVYWQTPNTSGNTSSDNWILYNSTGDLPGTAPLYDNEVYIGLITYAFGNNGVPFVGTCDAIEIIK